MGQFYRSALRPPHPVPFVVPIWLDYKCTVLQYHWGRVFGVMVLPSRTIWGVMVLFYRTMIGRMVLLSRTNGTVKQYRVLNLRPPFHVFLRRLYVRAKADGLVRDPPCCRGPVLSSARVRFPVEAAFLRLAYPALVFKLPLGFRRGIKAAIQQARRLPDGHGYLAVVGAVVLLAILDQQGPAPG